MKTVIGYIISLTAIFLLVIFLSAPTVDNDSTSLSMEESSVPEADMYSTDKTQKFNWSSDAISESLPEFVNPGGMKPAQKEPPVTVFSNCPDISIMDSLNCNSSSDLISEALGDYERAVDKCLEGSGTIEAVNTAWRELQKLCIYNGVIK